ncbi:phosphotransferase family protein [Minwuia sp.]|uniref:phosphotransferase family protein n=1 Tax=Minwuia sp. TaxID=2493630 RepID=UPI003A8D3ACE
MTDLNELAEEATRFVATTWGADHTVAHFGPMEDGHAGLSFGFSVMRGDREVEGVILRLAPKGVRRSGNTDVYRQAPLLRALGKAGVAVPPVLHAQSTEDWFGTPFVMTRRLPGRTMIIWEPAAEFDGRIADCWLKSARELATIHRFDWRRELPAWEAPRDMGDEIARWSGILERTDEEDWKAAGRRVAQRLQALPLQPSPIGLFHGDYQPGNVLFDGERISAILDWELAGIGPQLLDIGWLLMMGDPQSWAPDWAAPGVPPVADLVIAYETAMGESFDSIPYFQALSCFIFGVITCLNVKLHRTGKRHDPMWENFASSAPTLFANAERLLSRGSFHP